MRFTNCLPNACSYSDPNSREPPEPISHGTAPYHFQDVHIIKTSTCDVGIACKQQALGRKLTRDNDICHMVESHDDRTLEHHSGPARYVFVVSPEVPLAFVQCSAPVTHAVGNQIVCTTYVVHIEMALTSLGYTG
ncbi:hypothetical protein PISMIDRAFT_576906 [Pisolithus microcarpus 441]|uniref:Uncharacterized protein n=1 Tax=Pisolithus microcarpus 441 TaxID=765257 RepID=A0A0C9Y0K4_9AGAM|nr:hypothetical protein PISMIDRAFT_576906 [Pisolithus microcarpus 441]